MGGNTVQRMICRVPQLHSCGFLHSPWCGNLLLSQVYIPEFNLKKKRQQNCSLAVMKIFFYFNKCLWQMLLILSVEMSHAFIPPALIKVLWCAGWTGAILPASDPQMLRNSQVHWWWSLHLPAFSVRSAGLSICIQTIKVPFVSKVSHFHMKWKIHQWPSSVNFYSLEMSLLWDSCSTLKDHSPEQLIPTPFSWLFLV